MQVENQSFHTASTLKRTRFGFSAEVAADKPVASTGGTIEAVWKRAVTRHRTRQSRKIADSPLRAHPAYRNMLLALERADARSPKTSRDC